MATNQPPAFLKPWFQCPICGAWEQRGGCREIHKCLSALLTAGSEYTRDVVAVALQRRMQQRRVLSAGLEALSQLQIGLLLCDGAGRVMGANRVAESILECRDGLELNEDGILRAVHADCELAIQVEQVAKTAQKETQFQDTTVLAVPREVGRRPLAVFLRPSHTGFRKSALKAAVLVIVLDTARPLPVVTSELRQLFQLTNAEARLANLLMEGKELDLCCEELGIRRSTACTHLRRLFKKTGVHRQGELVALLWKSLGLARLAE